MILGAAGRSRPAGKVGSKLGGATQPDPGERRDRGRFLVPRLYPTAPFDPWQPVSSYLPATMRPGEVHYALVRESM